MTYECEVCKVLKRILEFAKKLKLLIDPTLLEIVLYTTKGKCPCKLGKECPCDDAPKEIEERGRCHCGLFIKLK